MAVLQVSDPLPEPDGAAAGPLPVMHVRAHPDWMDFNGHMNMAAYARVFDDALNTFLDSVGLGRAYIEECNGSIFLVQNNITYRREVLSGECLFVNLHLMDLDAKRMHLFLRMFNESRDIQAATAEMMTVHVDMTSRRSAPFPREAHERLDKLANAHRALPRPAEAGRPIAIRHGF